MWIFCRISLCSEKNEKPAVLESHSDEDNDDIEETEEERGMFKFIKHSFLCI